MRKITTDDLTLCERGNTLLDNDDGSMIAWLTIEGDTRLEVSWSPNNYPALNTSSVELTDEELAEHINNTLGGWHIRRRQIEGIRATNLIVDESDDQDDELDT